MSTIPTLSETESQVLLEILKKRFAKNSHRHEGITWEEVVSRLEKSSSKLAVIQLMEDSEGEPDVVGKDASSGEIIWMDCAPESPKGRRSLCYDEEAWLSRKEHKPASSVMERAEEMGIEVLDETDYRYLQSLETVDTKTSTWLQTPAPIRKLGGAIFGDFRYGQVFIYHNGAESYYGARGFRGKLKV